MDWIVTARLCGARMELVDLNLGEAIDLVKLLHGQGWEAMLVLKDTGVEDQECRCCCCTGECRQQYDEVG
jgi:hypothetical protein